MYYIDLSSLLSYSKFLLGHIIHIIYVEKWAKQFDIITKHLKDYRPPPGNISQNLWVFLCPKYDPDISRNGIISSFGQALPA